MDHKARSEAIRAEVERRRIAHVLHFTPAECLVDIGHLGILPRTEMDELNVGPRYVSSERWDGNDGAVSVSISRINYRMFKFKERGYPTAGWVILLLDRSILWTHQCRFFPENASKTRMRKRAAWADMGSLHAFSAMFQDASNGSGVSWRAKHSLADFMPTDEGAEVQVMRAIEPEQIAGAWVEHSVLADRVRADLSHLPRWPREVRVGAFSAACPFENVHVEADRELAEILDEFSVDDSGGAVYLTDGVWLGSDLKLSGLGD